MVMVKLGKHAMVGGSMTILTPKMMMLETYMASMLIPTSTKFGLGEWVKASSLKESQAWTGVGFGGTTSLKKRSPGA